MTEAENEMPSPPQGPRLSDQEYYILQCFNPGSLLSINNLINQTGLRQSALEKYLSSLTLTLHLQRQQVGSEVKFKITSKGLRASGRAGKEESELEDTGVHTDISTNVHTKQESQQPPASIHEESTNSLLIDYSRGKKIGRPSVWESEKLTKDIITFYPNHTVRQIAKKLGCTQNLVSRRISALVKRGELKPKPGTLVAMERKRTKRQTVEPSVIPKVEPTIILPIPHSNGFKLKAASDFIETVRRLGAERGFQCGFRIEYDDTNIDPQGDGLLCRISMEAAIQGDDGKKGVRRL